MFFYWIYAANIWREYVILRVSVGPSGPRLEKIYNFRNFCWGKVHISLDLCCQHLGLYVNWGVSVGPSGPGFGNLHFLTLFY